MPPRLTRIQKASKKVTGLDVYGVPVSWNFSGDDTFKSLYGAIVSVFVITICLWMTFYRVIVMWQKADTNMVYALGNLDFEDEGAISMNDLNGLQFVVGMTGYD